MHFHSPLFVLVFLPVIIAGFFLIGRCQRSTPALIWLLSASLFFFAMASANHLWVLALSIALNYSGALALAKYVDVGNKRRFILLWATIAGNVGLLFYFKAQLSPWFAGISEKSSFVTAYGDARMIPLGLSFITFQQIGYVVDVHKQRVNPGTLLEYTLFVTFFPQIVMGPIVRFRDLTPQFRCPTILRPNGDNLAAGFFIFACGFFKKVILADQLAPIVDSIFDTARTGAAIHPADAVLAAAAFQFQLYFDFSAYSDMAIGMARMINIHLPINFYHPFRAVDRFDLWRRWHLTFVAFMREYVFQPLVRQLGFPAPAALVTTALLSGLWHGLSWGFLFWGLLTGLLLLLRHYWINYQQSIGWVNKWRLPKSLSIAVTFAITAIMGVLFRSGDIAVAGHVLLSAVQPARIGSILAWDGIALMGLCAVIVWAMPNLQEIMRHHWRGQAMRPQQSADDLSAALWRPGLLRYEPILLWGALSGLMLAAALLGQGDTTRFLYYQF